MSVQEFAIFGEKPFLARSHIPVKSHFVMCGEDLENNSMSVQEFFISWGEVILGGEAIFWGEAIFREKPFSGEKPFYYQGRRLRK